MLIGTAPRNVTLRVVSDSRACVETLKDRGEMDAIGESRKSRERDSEKFSDRAGHLLSWPAHQTATLRVTSLAEVVRLRDRDESSLREFLDLLRMTISASLAEPARSCSDVLARRRSVSGLSVMALH